MKVENVSFKSLRHNLVGELIFPNDLKNKAPAVMLLHGLSNSRKDCPLINELAEALIKNGYIVFRFDFFGSGDSSGLLKNKTLNILKMNAFDGLKFLSKDKRVKDIGVWGRSLGGTLATYCGLNKKVKATVFASPSIFLTRNFKKERFGKIMKKEEELEKIGKKLPGTGNYKGPFELHPKFFDELKFIEREILEILPNLKNVLVLTTTPDIKVPLACSMEIINSVKEPKRIHVFEGVNHDYKDVEDRAVEMIINWLDKYLHK